MVVSSLSSVLCMSSLEKRLAVFAQLPIKAQWAMIVSSKTNKTLNQNKAYIESLEQIHSSSVANATSEEKLAYFKAKESIAD